MSDTKRGSRSEWPLRRVSLPSAISGGLWLTELPGSIASLADFVSVARDIQITRLICLVDPAHVAAKF